MNNRQLKIMGGVLGVLVIPLLLTLFSESWNWGLMDFVIAGILLSVLGLSMEWMWRTIKNKKLLLFVLVLVVAVFVLLWAELAVGIFNSPFAGS